MRIALIITAATLVASPALADPHKPPSRDPQSRQRSAPVILAAAETHQGPATDPAQHNSAPPKRVGRLTTCRCGDPQTGEESPDR